VREGGGRRPTIDPVVVGRAVYELDGFDKESLNHSMKMTGPTIGPHTHFKQLKRNFLTFLSLKASYLIPQLSLRESGVWLDKAAHNYAFTLLLHATSENKRADQAVKYISPSRSCCATAAWDILRERLYSTSFARSMSLLDTLMLRQRPGHSPI
jgi:hypothetical protein